MKYKTLRQRLKIYEIALTDYLLVKEAGKEVRFSGYYDYLCHYFTYNHIVNIHDPGRYHTSDKYIEFSEALPELWETRPKGAINGEPWFLYENEGLRIKCLQKAIKITENKIKKQEKTLAK